MRKRLENYIAVTVEAFNAFCWEVFIVIMGTGALVIPSQWWVSTNCIQNTSRMCEFTLAVTHYWWVFFLLAIALALTLALIKWLRQMVAKSH